MDSKRVTRELRNPCSKYWKGRPCSKSFNAGSNYIWSISKKIHFNNRSRDNFTSQMKCIWIDLLKSQIEIGRLWSGRSYKECQPHGINLKRCGNTHRGHRERRNTENEVHNQLLRHLRWLIDYTSWCSNQL